MVCDALIITQKTGWRRRRQNRKQEGQLRDFYSLMEIIVWVRVVVTRKISGQILHKWDGQEEVLSEKESPLGLSLERERCGQAWEGSKSW